MKHFGQNQKLSENDAFEVIFTYIWGFLHFAYANIAGNRQSEVAQLQWGFCFDTKRITWVPSRQEDTFWMKKSFKQIVAVFRENPPKTKTHQS